MGFRCGIETLVLSRADPAREAAHAKGEGVELPFNRQPVEIASDAGVEGVKVVTTKLGAPDERGRPRDHRLRFPAQPTRMVRLPGSRDRRRRLGDPPGKGRFQHQTTNPRIFADGDMVRGSDLVVTAVFEGREAGKSILRYLET